jgi:hypothetical protein
VTVARRLLIFVALPLVLGAASYVLWRTYVPLLGLPHRPLWPSAPAALRDHFADAAWGFAVGAFVASIWQGGPRAIRWAWYGVGLAVCAGVECLQVTHMFPGAFDALDLAAQVGAFAVGVMAVGGVERWTSASATA